MSISLILSPPTAKRSTSASSPLGATTMPTAPSTSAGSANPAFLTGRGSGCSTGTGLMAIPLIRANTTDGAATAAGITLDRSAGTVTVAARTQHDDGSTTIPMTFARVLGRSSVGVTATATARWTPRRWVNPIMVAVPQCFFDASTAHGTAYGPSHPVTYRHRTGTSSCPAAPRIEVDLGWWTFTYDNVCNPNSWCEDDLARRVGTEVAVTVVPTPPAKATFPVVDQSIGFMLTGYRTNNGHRGGSTACTQDDCISGYFTRTAHKDGSLGWPLLGGGATLVP